RRRSSGGGAGAWPVSPLLRPARPTGGAGGGRGLAGLGGRGGLLRGMALRRGSGELRRDRAHQRSVVAMVGRDGSADLILVLAVGVSADVDAGDELDAVEIAEPVDATARLRLRRVVLVGHAARRVEDAADQAAPHVGPVRALRAAEADQRPDLAPGKGPF